MSVRKLSRAEKPGPWWLLAIVVVNVMVIATAWWTDSPWFLLTLFYTSCSLGWNLRLQAEGFEDS